MPALSKLREAKNMTIKELAERSGVHLIKLYQIESGKIKTENMSLKNAARIATALDCDPRDLLPDD